MHAGRVTGSLVGMTGVARAHPLAPRSGSSVMTGSRRALALAAMLMVLAAAFAAPIAASAQQRAARPKAGSPPRAAAVRTHDNAGPTAVAGYAWSGATNSYYTYDSTGQTATVTFDGTGSYFVMFPGLGHLTNEHVDLTTYGPAAECMFFNTQPEPSDMTIAIACNTPSGAPEDSAFDVVITQPTRTRGETFDYDLVPAARSGKLTGLGQYNSSGKANSVRHLSTGRYQVTLPGPSASGVTGTVQVTDVLPVIGPNGDCELAGWHGTRAGQVVDVGCFSPSGGRENRTFGLSYVRSGNLLGAGGLTSAYAYANRPTATVYQPRTQYDSKRGAGVVVFREGRGQYLVIPAGSGGPSATNGGNVEISAVGTADLRCYVNDWAQGTIPDIYVDCVNRLGITSDSAFTIQWVVA
jgi:hypothetical protein